MKCRKITDGFIGRGLEVKCDYVACRNRWVLAIYNGLCGIDKERAIEMPAAPMGPKHHHTSPLNTATRVLCVSVCIIMHVYVHLFKHQTVQRG